MPSPNYNKVQTNQTASCGSCASSSNNIRENFTPMRQPQSNACHFPAPAANRCYCQAAPFSTADGSTYQRLTEAYGNSTPCSQ